MNTRSRFLDRLRQLNRRRCEEAFGHGVEGWNEAEWGCAIAGEVGELCNLLKKLRRGDAVSLDAICEEVADVVIYLDLLCAKLGIELAPEIASKFDKVSERVGWPGPSLKGTE